MSIRNWKKNRPLQKELGMKEGGVLYSSSGPIELSSQESKGKY